MNDYVDLCIELGLMFRTDPDAFLSRSIGYVLNLYERTQRVAAALQEDGR